MSTTLSSPVRAFRAMVAVLLVIGYAILVSVQFTARYRGTWVEQDTTQLTEATRNVQNAGELMPPVKIYPFGFGYSATLTFLSNVVGVPLDFLQGTVGPFALVMTGTCALAVYRQLTGSVRLATLSAILLCMQPDLVFVTLRGSHERFTWTIVMLTVLLLVKSFGYAGRWKPFVALILLSYVTTFALVSLNSFFASSFIVTLAISFAVGWLLIVKRLREQEHFDRNVGRLLYMVGSSTVLVYIFIFHLYLPAGQIFELLDRGLDRLATLLLNFDPLNVAAPYEYVSIGWISPHVYFGLTIGSWFILLVSLVAWGRLAHRSFLRRERPPLNHLLLWLFYGAFAGQIAISMVMDLFNFLSTNLQMRLFPAVMLFAIPLALTELRRFWAKVFQHKLRRVVGPVLLFLALWLSSTSLLKATVDPVVSNKWLYFTSGEYEAMTWTEDRLERITVWVGYDERLRQLAYSRWGSNLLSRNDYDILAIEAYTRYIFLSDLVRQQAARIRQPLPVVWLAHLIYHNGSVELYQYRPRTPYER